MHIVLAANPEADQPWVVDATAKLAKQTGASVAVVSVDELELERLSPTPRSVYREQAARAASAAVERLATAGVEASKTVLSGRALDRILEFTEAERADLVVVGASTRPAVTERLLGSVPLALIHRSSRPVIVVTDPSHGGSDPSQG
jgi:nucleotide-binding universal stress UspA family protein